MADPRRPAQRPARRVTTLVAGGAAAALLATGCATIPSSGRVESTPVPPPSGGGTACCGLVVQGPQPDWSPDQIVSGFLLASASFAHSHAIAREYLTPAASRSWQPRQGVTILAQPPKVSQEPQRVTGPENTVTVVVTGQKLATLDSSGQYTPASRGGLAAQQQHFTLERVKGHWRIAGLPSAGLGKISHELLLTDDLFHVVYTPRDLYFYGQPDQVLVPDPVFVPVESPDPAATLVAGLMHDPKGWLSGAAFSAFPPGAWPRKVQILPGPPGGTTAIVDIGLPRATSQSTVQMMAAELVWTLTSPAYGPSLVQAVKIKINGRLWSPPGGGPVQGLDDYTGDVARWRGNAALFYLSAGGAVRTLGRLADRSVAAPGQAGTGQLPLSTVAISPDGRYLAGVAGPTSTVYTTDLAEAARLHASTDAKSMHSQLTGTGFTAPSWDLSDELWVAGRVHGSPGVWVLPPPPSHGPPVRVMLPSRLGPVTGLRVAPDGVRIALIVGTGAAAHLVVAAIVHDGTMYSIQQTVPLGSNLPRPSALAWYDEDHLLVISQSSAGSRLWEIPLNGEQPTLRGEQAGMTSIAAAGPQNPLYLGLSDGQLERSVGLGEPWSGVTAGRAAAYPG